MLHVSTQCIRVQAEDMGQLIIFAHPNLDYTAEPQFKPIFQACKQHGHGVRCRNQPRCKQESN